MQARCKNCPNIVRFKEQFMANETHFISMEYMPGGDLQQFLSQRSFKPVPVKMAKSIMLQLGQALKYLHSHKIIHRDIKLENVMLSSH